MTLASLRERYALDVFEPIWKKKGYTVIREPAPDQLPIFLKGLRPDAIATGATPSLVIEIAAGRGENKSTQILRLKSALETQSDWRLEVVFVGSEGEPAKPASPAAIDAALRRAQELAGREPGAALLLAWAAFESLGRLIEPRLGEFTLGAMALVDLLVGNGHISQQDGQILRTLAATRNKLAHGELEAALTADDVRTLVDLAERLLAASSTAEIPQHEGAL